MKKILLIILLIVNFFVGKAQTANELLYMAKEACLSSDYKKAYSLYSQADSIDSLIYFYDLYYYYITAEMIKDSAKTEELLYRLAQSNGFERDFMQYYFDHFKTYKRPYWGIVDSLINVTESNRCQPFIDSLAVMAELDQSIREKEWTDDVIKQANVIDSINMAKLLKLIEQYGFPTWKLVGEQGSTNAWLIAQHSPEYIHWYLKQYRKAVEDNNAGRQELAYMEDRILAMECRPQIYGTQLGYKNDGTLYLRTTIDMKRLNERRYLMDLPAVDDHLKSAGMENVDLYHGYGNYLTEYYPNLNSFYMLVNYWENKIECPDSVLFYSEKEIYWFPNDLENIANYYYKYDTTFAVKTAKKMVLFGHTLDDDWNLYQPLMDTVKECYAELRADYERLINKEIDIQIQAMTSFDTLVKFLDSGCYHRYEIDSWNNHIKKLIREKSETLTKQDYKDFFSWLFKQVEAGDYHLFDYAELYDEVHYRLFKTSYYGQKDFGKKVRIYKPKQLESRRSEIKLQSLELISNE